jgi:hypothetical protein
LSIAHESLVAGFGSALRTLVVSGIWQPVISALRLDPVYAGAAVRSLGSIQTLGLAVTGSVGAALHALRPDVFLPPDQVRSGAFTSMVAVPGASVLARMTAAFGADAVLLCVGLLLTRRARGRTWMAILGLFMQAQVVIGHLLRAQIGARQLDASGVPFALALLSPMFGWRSTEALAALPRSWQAFIVALALVILAYVAAFLVFVVARLPNRVLRRRRASNDRHASLSRRILAVSVALAVATGLSPLGRAAMSESNWQPVDQPPSLGSVNLQASATLNWIVATGGPHPVSLVQNATGDWQYLADGQPKIIRGVGYNPQYAALPASERARLYQRDFSAIRRIGANTIEGWFEDQFDEVTLAYARQNGLGVIMPFELNQDWNYSDPAVQAEFLGRVSDWVLRYRANPAVRMWAPGNENLHRVLYRNWVSQEQVPAARARALAFAAFLPRLVDRIHELDPNHPVLYRDAEDVYLGWLKQGFDSSPKPRPWLVYGANVYSPIRLDQIIAAWPTQWIGGPLVISEFAPAGLGPDARAPGYQQDWQRIRSRPGIVLGGLAYTWATNGPEDLDRVFGLVDANGNPWDAALSALAAAYLSDPKPADSSAASLTQSG